MLSFIAGFIVGFVVMFLFIRWISNSIYDGLNDFFGW